jgi:hypothetical protein
VIDQITSSGALGLFEGEFITSGVLTTLISTIETRFAALQFAAFGTLQQTLIDTSGIIENSGLYTTESFNTFEVAYQSGLLVQTEVLASGIFAQLNGEAITNQFIIDTNNAIITASGNLEVQQIFLTMASQITEEETEYFINDASGLIALQEYVNRGSGTTDLTFKLVNDISLSGLNWIPIGHGSATPPQFQGAFNGSGFAIEDIIITSAENNYLGLFGDVGSSGVIQNLTLSGLGVIGSGFDAAENSIFKLNYNQVGLLAGRNAGTISNITVTSKVSISTNQDVGGLIGLNTGSLTNVTISSPIIELFGEQNLGGLIGLNSAGTINTVLFNVSSYVDIEVQQNYAGGFIGRILSGTVNKVYFETPSLGIYIPTTNVTEGYLGGFIGRSDEVNVSDIIFNLIPDNPNQGLRIQANDRSKSYIGGFVGSPGNSTFKNINFNLTSGVINLEASNSVGLLTGGSPGNQNTIFSGIIVSFDNTRYSLLGAADGYLVGRIPIGGSLSMNNVYYTSGVTSSGTLVLAGVTNNTFYTFDTPLSESGLTEITSDVILSIINSNDVFEFSGNNFPVFKEVGVITSTVQRQIAIPWIEE